MERTVDKHTLNNFLRHVDAHNKIQEEREMWRLRELERKSDYEKTERPSRAPLLTRGRLVSDVFDDSETEGGTFHTAVASRAPASTYWTRQLMKAEENDPFRWGHSGFKEQNPEEFVSSDDDDENNCRNGIAKVNDKERKTHKRKKHKQHKQKDRQKDRHSDDESSDEEQKDKHSDDESSDEEETEQKHKKKAKRNKANSKKVRKSKKRSSEAKQ